MWNSDTRQHAIRAAIAVLGVAMIFGIGVWLRPAPQIGSDPHVFKTVDALFTAITSHDRSRLDECEKRLHNYREAEHLPVKAATFLDQVILQARSGAWQPAARKLYDFILKQRR